MILRKSLYVTDVRADKNSQELLHSPEDVRNLFKSARIRFVVVADNVPLGFQSQVMLRDYLRNDQFQLLGTFPIQSNEPAWQGKSLQLYENKSWAPPEDKFLRIRMLTLNHDIVLPLDHFEFAQKSPALNGQGDK